MDVCLSLYRLFGSLTYVSCIWINITPNSNKIRMKQIESGVSLSPFSFIRLLDVWHVHLNKRHCNKYCLLHIQISIIQISFLHTPFNYSHSSNRHSSTLIPYNQYIQSTLFIQSKTLQYKTFSTYNSFQKQRKTFRPLVTGQTMLFSTLSNFQYNFQKTLYLHCLFHLNTTSANNLGTIQIDFIFM